jgi:ABC-type transport system involved in multi-copper enzyme maturation permease subunit
MGSCYNDKIKNYCKWVVSVVSVILFILGGLTLLLGALAMGMVENKTKFMPEFKIDESGLGLGILLLGGIVLITSILGCCLAKNTNMCFAIPFMILTLLFGIVMVIIGLIAINVSGPVVDKLKIEVCTSDQAKSLNGEYKNAVSKYVCSNICPCPEGDDQENKLMWEGYGNEILGPFNRAKNFNSMDK